MTPTSLLVASVLVVVRMHSVSCGIVDDQACANYVQKQCKCDIDIEFIGNNKHNAKMCKTLQSCADCLAEPRCLSTYLDQFRSLLRLTLVMSKQTSICPNISYKNLIAGSQTSCKGDGFVYNRCGQRCDCQGGMFTNCFRLRKEFTQMSFAERRRFVNAYYKATTDRFLKDDFQKILDAHSQIPSDFLHHMPQIFLPWHRWYLLKIENFLRQVDCRVTLPYFQWTAPGKQRWRTTDPKDVWNGGPQGLGGNGVFPSWCVKDGKFREGEWSLPVLKGGGCLKRSFNKTCDLFNEKQLHKLLRTNSFKKFEETVREELHSAYHDCIGGDMPDNRVAANAPEFVLHHGFMDKIWDQWQDKGYSFKYKYYTTINMRMPVADTYPWQYLDNSNLPGAIGVIYQKFKEPKYRKKATGNKKPRREDEIIEEEYWDEEDLADEEK